MLCLERRDSEVGGEVEGTEREGEGAREKRRHKTTALPPTPLAPNRLHQVGQLVVNGVLTV